MPFKIYNTLTRSTEPFEPIEEGQVRFYACGPTVYDYAHIGNFRAYIFVDLLKRHLAFCGFDVTLVMNLTDVDDKTIRGAQANRIELEEYTHPYKEAFFSDLQSLRIEKAESYPAATDHIPEMIELIRTLVEKGLAYASEDGSVYFSIGKFEGYGCLAHLDMEGLQAGARVSQDEYEKENVSDFALWKAWSEADGDVGWDSPWGKGRPGWHLECSAMSMKYLGETFDLHAGGIDLIFPHHEDEIAQSEGATGKKFVNYWAHCAHLVVEGKKMSKSAGNFYTLRNILDRGYTGREVRYVLLATHYRQTLNFTFSGLDGARSALQRLDDFVERLDALAGSAAPSDTPSWAQDALAAFTKALNDDLNISEALAALYDMIRTGNTALDQSSLSAEAAAATRVVLGKMDSVLGVVEKDDDAVGQDVLDLIEQRKQARVDKDWAKADEIRDAILALGFALKDTPAGTTVKRITKQAAE